MFLLYIVEIVVWVNVIFETKRFVIRILEQVHIKVGAFINLCTNIKKNFNRIILKYTFIIFYVLKWDDFTKKDSGKQCFLYWCRVSFAQVVWRLVSHSTHLSTSLFKFRLQTGHESVFSKVLAISIDGEFTSQSFKVR